MIEFFKNWNGLDYLKRFVDMNDPGTKMIVLQAEAEGFKVVPAERKYGFTSNELLLKMPDEKIAVCNTVGEVMRTIEAKKFKMPKRK